MEGDAVEGPIVCICIEEVLQALNEMKTGKAHGSSEVSLEMITASRGVGIQVMAEICQKVLYGFKMPDELAVTIVVPIFKEKDDVRNCGCYGAVKLLEHRMKVVERVLAKILRRMVIVDKMQFGFMPERGKIGAVFILRRLQEEYRAKEKSYISVL